MTWTKLNTFQSSSETLGITLFIVNRESRISILRLSFNLLLPEFIGLMAAQDGTVNRCWQHLAVHQVDRIVELIKL